MVIRILIFVCCLLAGGYDAPVRAAGQAQAMPATAALFDAFPGRWVGKGRLFFKGGKTEDVKCRVTYFVSGDKLEMKQNIRCASASGKIEVKSFVRQDGDKLSGSWKELIYDVEGELSGRAIKDGLKVEVRSQQIAANMQILFRGKRQIAEIQFHNETLIGLTIILERG